MRNTGRCLIRGRSECIKNSREAREALDRWLSLGYDKLNIGGGNKNLSGFINVDFAFSHVVERQVVANITDLSFVPALCISHIHSNHVLEHLRPEELRRHLRECHRILRPDGLLTIRCPNALGAAYAFWFDAVLAQGRDEFIALGFPADEDFDSPSDKWLEKDFYGLLHWFYGDVGNIRNQHLNRITPSMLRDCLEEAGFSISKMAEPEAINIVVVAKKV